MNDSSMPDTQSKRRSNQGEGILKNSTKDVARNSVQYLVKRSLSHFRLFLFETDVVDAFRCIRLFRILRLLRLHTVASVWRGLAFSSALSHQARRKTTPAVRCLIVAPALYKQHRPHCPHRMLCWGNCLYVRWKILVTKNF